MLLMGASGKEHEQQCLNVPEFALLLSTPRWQQQQQQQHNRPTGKSLPAFVLSFTCICHLLLILPGGLCPGLW
jgi:hypothetical protein